MVVCACIRLLNRQSEDLTSNRYSTGIEVLKKLVWNLD